MFLQKMQKGKGGNGLEKKEKSKNGRVREKVRKFSWRMKEEEFEKIEKDAAEMNITPSEFIRQRMSAYQKPQMPPEAMEALNEMRAEIRGNRTAINEVEKKYFASNEGIPKGIEELKKIIRDEEDMVNRIYKMLKEIYENGNFKTGAD